MLVDFIFRSLHIKIAKYNFSDVLFLFTIMSILSEYSCLC